MKCLRCLKIGMDVLYVEKAHPENQYCGKCYMELVRSGMRPDEFTILKKVVIPLKKEK